MMTKKEAIRRINEGTGASSLSNANTHWSNIVNYSSDQGWWLNIRFPKFTQDLHLILNNEKAGTFLHIEIPANSITIPSKTFRDKEGEADIFMPIAGSNRLVDVQSGSARHDFNSYKATEYAH